MRLESARDLKEEVRSRVLEPLAERFVASRSLAIAARETPASSQRHRFCSIGIAPGPKEHVKLAIRVQRRALMDSDEIDRIRRMARGEVDLRYVGRIEKRAVPWYRKRQRPLRIGCSVGHYAITVGTLGCFVRTASGARPLMLSNAHVLANENLGQRGDPILQPGDYDRGRQPKDVVGKLRRSVRLKLRDINYVDAAIAEINEAIGVESSSIRQLGRMSGLVLPIDTDGIRVAKLGRTTGLTFGRVSAFELDNVVVQYDMGNLTFDNQIEIESTGRGSFSDGGDSGSLIVSRDGFDAVGLLFAGSDQGGAGNRGLTYVNVFSNVLKELKVKLLPG